MIDWQAFDWQSFATLTTGLAAVGGAVFVGNKQASITRRQTEIMESQVRLAERTLAHELYDRRFEVYRATRTIMLGTVFGDQYAMDPEERKAFLIALGESRFLLGEATYEAIREVSENTHELYLTRQRIANGIQTNGTPPDGSTERELELNTWFTTRLQNLHELFPQLNLG